MLGNKSDKEGRHINTDEGKNFAETNDMYFFETSAKTSEKVEESFNFLLNKIVTKMKEDSINQEEEVKMIVGKSIILLQEKKEESSKKGCCN